MISVFTAPQRRILERLSKGALGSEQVMEVLGTTHWLNVMKALQRKEVVVAKETKGGTKYAINAAGKALLKYTN